MRYHRVDRQERRAPKEFVIDCGIASFERFDAIVARATSLRSPSIKPPSVRSPSSTRSHSRPLPPLPEDHVRNATSPLNADIDPVTGLRTLLLNEGQTDQTSVLKRDGGKAANVVLIAAIVFRSALLGLPLAYGVFQAKYSTIYPGNTTAVWIGVLSNGIRHLGAPLIQFCCSRLNFKIQRYQVVGWALCVSALYLSIWLTSLDLLIVTQGALFGLGSLFAETPTLTMINTWYERKRGLAYSLIFSGADVFSIIYTFLITYLLSAHSLKFTLSILTGTIFWICGPAIILLRKHPVEKNPQLNQNSRTSSRVANRAEFRYYRRPVYYLLSLVDLCHSLAHNIPYIYLPSFSKDLGHAHILSAALLATASVGNITGQICFGLLSDRLPVKFLIVGSTAIASLAVIELWGKFAAHSIPALFAFAYVYPFFSAGYLACKARTATLFSETDALKVYSHMACGRGVCTIAAGPISSMLLKGAPAVDPSKYAAGKYALLASFVQYCMMGAAVTGTIAMLALWLEHSYLEVEFRVRKRPTSFESSEE